MLDTKAFVAEMVRSVRLAISKAVDPLSARLDAFEKSLKELPAPQNGEKGDPGEKGQDGGVGQKGDSGEPGTKGDRGEPGEKGEAGQSGEKGEQGVAGEPGSVGEKGEKGQDGINGKDADEVGITAKVLESVTKALESIPAPQDGKDGESIHPDSVALMVKAEVEKAVALIPKAQDGRDATEFEVLPAIEIDKSYARRSWARHGGGLWRAFADTKGMEGWECIVDGDAEETVEVSDDGRTRTYRKVKSSGKVIETIVTEPTMFYRDIWREGVYKRGDVVTRDGCAWHANKETEAIPGSSTDWQLIVKKGRDGRDGLKGEKGERGSQGKDGADLTQKW